MLNDEGEGDGDMVKLSTSLMNTFCTNVVKQVARFFYLFIFIYFYFYCSFRLAPPRPLPPPNFFAVVLLDYGVKLPSYTFYRGIVVGVPVRFFFSAAQFHLCGR